MGSGVKPLEECVECTQFASKSIKTNVLESWSDFKLFIFCVFCTEKCSLRIALFKSLK